MSDTAAEFRRKNAAQFAKARHQLLEIAIRYTALLAWDLIATTPGPNLQYPYDTEYIATGRLRAGWRLSLEALGGASRWDGGPYTEHGTDTLAGIEAQARAFIGHNNPPRAVYIANEVAYGYIVHHGLGRHTKARPWVENVATDSPERAAREARAEVMGR